MCVFSLNGWDTRSPVSSKTIYRLMPHELTAVIDTTATNQPILAVKDGGLLRGAILDGVSASATSLSFGGFFLRRRPIG